MTKRYSVVESFRCKNRLSSAWEIGIYFRSKQVKKDYRALRIDYLPFVCSVASADRAL
jgi:hypothetical protein